MALLLVEYWRRRYQRMNSERFVAANIMALVTHTVVSICSSHYAFRPNPLTL